MLIIPMHRLLSLWPRHWGAYWQLIQKQFRGSWNLTIIKPNLKPLLGSAAKTNSTLSCMLFCLNAQCDCSGFCFGFWFLLTICRNIGRVYYGTLLIKISRNTQLGSLIIMQQLFTDLVLSLEEWLANSV